MPDRRTQSARSAATRDQILQAALTVFALKGYAASSMEDVAMASGCSKGGLYHHFRSKSRLLQGVVDRLAAKGWLMPPVSSEGALAPAALGRVLIETWAEAARDEALGRQLRHAYDQTVGETMVDREALEPLLRLGALVQLLTRPEDVDAGAAARRLGVERAA